MKFIYLNFDPTKGVRGGVKINTDVLIHRQWAIMAHSDKLLDIIALENEKFLILKANTVFAL